MDYREIAAAVFARMLELNGFLYISALMYVIFAVGLIRLGASYHGATVSGAAGPGQFPEGYFAMLVVQLLPLTVTGFILSDVFVISTRIGTLVAALVVYGLVSSRDGTFDSPRYEWWATFWLAFGVPGTMFWFYSPTMQWIVWSAIIAMFARVIWGQRVAARTLFHHFVAGNYPTRRLRLQIVRFFAFLTQATHYWYVPSKAAPVFGLDPIFLQGAIALLGVAFVLMMALFGFIRGGEARREKKFELGRSQFATS